MILCGKPHINSLYIALTYTSKYQLFNIFLLMRYCSIKCTTCAMKAKFFQCQNKSLSHAHILLIIYSLQKEMHIFHFHFFFFFSRKYKVSHCTRKPTICICENKNAAQLRSNCEADQRLCFRYTDSTIPLLFKSEISSL